SVVKKSPLTKIPTVIRGCSPRSRDHPNVAIFDVASPSNDLVRRWRSSMSAYENRPTGLLCVSDVRRTTRPVAGTGRGRSRKASIRLKIDAVAPTPSAVENSTASEKPLLRRISRSAYRTSRNPVTISSRYVRLCHEFPIGRRVSRRFYDRRQEGQHR